MQINCYNVIYIKIYDAIKQLLISFYVLLTFMVSMIRINVNPRGS